MRYSAATSQQDARSAKYLMGKRESGYCRESHTFGNFLIQLQFFLSYTHVICVWYTLLNDIETQEGDGDGKRTHTGVSHIKKLVAVEVHRYDVLETVDSVAGEILDDVYLGEHRESCH
jgi:hypothetical protein